MGDLEHFNALDRKGLMMYGQMTAGSWIYIGSQGIVQGTYETFSEIGRRHFGGNLAGPWFVTAGLGGMGGAQPLAATMAGASLLQSNANRPASSSGSTPGYLDAKQTTPRRAGDDRRACRDGNRSRLASSAMSRKYYPTWCDEA